MKGRRKILLAALLAALFASSCSKLIAYRYWNVYGMIEPAVSSGKRYSDGNIDVRFWIDEKKIHLKLRNTASEPLVIHWGKGAFVNVDGKRYSIANIDSVFTGRRDDPLPTTVGPGESIVDFVAPVKNVEKLEEWTWYVYPLFNLVDDSAYDNKGKVFGIDLPVEINGKWRTYSFRFQVTHVTPITRRAR